MPTKIFVVKKIEDARRLAAQEFNAPENLIVVKILDEKKGLFGRVKELTVEAMYEEPPVFDPAKARHLEPFETTIPPYEEVKARIDAENRKKAEEAAAAAAAAEQETVSAAAATPDTADAAPEAAAEEDAVETRSLEEEIAAAVPFAEDEIPQNLANARDYIIHVYEKLGVAVTVSVSRISNGILMNVDSEAKSGTIIGRRGETLDSIQYLASIIANRGMNAYNRLMLDSNGYRVKRRNTLEQLAEKIARNVLRNGRTTTLEPMNPYERRIIHSKIAEIEGVVSHSVGEDPYRKVVVAPVAGAAKNHRRGQRGGNNYRHGGNNQNRKSRPQKRPEDFKPSNLDGMKTSFEKDYKKPRPEDEIHTGLYGKIEL